VGENEKPPISLFIFKTTTGISELNPDMNIQMGFPLTAS
jgi:hypothetical protein